jgi:cell division protein FtsI (penicillin-binding protein 3)
MMRINLLLLVTVIASALYLVQVQYESRRLYAEIERAQNEARKLEVENERLQVDKRAQATPARVQQLARDQLQMRAATPAITQYVTLTAGRGARRCQPMSRHRAVAYTSSPLLASPTPVWRSKLIVAAIALGFLALAGRAAWVQVIANEFYRKQGEVRFARTLELPANRGRIFDRNGLLLASSVPVPSIWAIPEDVERDPTKLAQLARLLQMPLPELMKRLADEDKNFVWLKREVDEAVARHVATLDIKGIYQRKEYRRQYPEGAAAAHLVGFTSIEDSGQEGIELAFNKDLAGRPGSRRVIKDRLGRIVEDVGQQVRPVEGKDLQLSIDSKVQFFAFQQLREAVQANKAKAGSVVVLDAESGEVLALANYPSYDPAHRQNLSGAQLRNRAFTDTFEPGSTMKPITVAMALEAAA